MTNSEAIEWFKNSAFYHKDHTPFNMAISALEKERQGHWIRWREERTFEGGSESIPHCKCSECDKEYDTHTAQFINYCPNCGAEMTDNETKAQ